MHPVRLVLSTVAVGRPSEVEQGIVDERKALL